MTHPNPGTLDDAGLVRWAKSLPNFAQAAAAHAVDLRKQATAAEEKYPSRKEYVAGLHRAARMAIQAALVLADVAPKVQNVTNVRDFDRIEAPRGNLTQEARADNRPAQEDRDNWGKQ